MCADLAVPTWRLIRQVSLPYVLQLVMNYNRGTSQRSTNREI